jgi:leucyl-tRNA synthetase
VWNLLEILEDSPDDVGDGETEKELLIKLHQTIKKVTLDIDGEFHFNTAISAVMELVNHVYSGISEKGKSCYSKKCLRQVLSGTVLLIAPFVPHMAEEINERLGGGKSVFTMKWPEYREDMLETDMVVVPVQVNGKLKSTVELSRGATDDEVKEKTLLDEKIKSAMSGKTVKKWIILRDKLVNIVVGA